ncbi:MAG: TIGR03986 family CRISPR-associated RAMP protein [Chromatiales bacterium]|nr:TIGR03986 family CRISPR-associated RAMP protein [Chromatiales bacterium]
MPVKAPFRFARINRWIYEPAWAPLVSHDVPFADGLSGEAEVKITAKSSILVGGDRRKATAEEAGEVRPFQLPDGAYAIPGSALQGMARAILEVAGFGRLGPWVENRKFGLRDLSGTPTARQHYRSRLSSMPFIQEGAPNEVTINSKAGWLMKSPNGSPCILPCEYARIRLDDVLSFKQTLNPKHLPGVLYLSSDAKQRYCWFLKNLGQGKAVLDAHFEIDCPEWHSHTGEICIRYSRCRHDATGQGTPGTLVLTGKPEAGTGRRKKNREFVFHTPNRVDKPIAGHPQPLPVDDDVWKAFLLLHEEQPGRKRNPSWDFWKGEFDANRRVPVFYWEETPREVTTLGMAFAFKAAHRKSTHDLLGHSCADHLDPVVTMKLDLAHLIFGVAAEHDDGRGLKRRARFGLARAEGEPLRCTPGHPSILLGPKPSYAGLYVRQRHDNNPLQADEPLATYTPLNPSANPPAAPHLHRPELAGVKIWPARGAGKFDPDSVPTELADNHNVQTTLVTLPPGTVFRSRLTFHNLRPVELGALLWALSFGDEAAFGDDSTAVTKRHRLGMGKPLGLGEVAIRMTGLKTEPTCSTSSTEAPVTGPALLCTFKEHMESTAAYGRDWSNSKQVKALLKAADPTRNAASDPEYMTLQEYQDAKKDSAYLPDYVQGNYEKRAWVDETIELLMEQHHVNNELQILRGRPLANAWNALGDPALKRKAFQDIRSRWIAQGWWDNPGGVAAQQARQIYRDNAPP